MDELTPEQTREQAQLTARGMRNLRLIDGKWYGLRVQDGRKHVCQGEESQAGYDELSDALKALEAIRPGLGAPVLMSSFWRSQQLESD